MISAQPTSLCRAATDKQVDAIITSYPANSIGSNAARNLTSKLKGTMLKSVAENLLKSFVARGWLSISRRSRYSLAPRAIAELEGWLAAEYEDYIQKCARCAKTVFSVRPDMINDLAGR